MTSKLLLTAVSLTALAITACASHTTTIPNSASVESLTAKLSTAQTVADFPFRPGNPSVTPDGRILMSVHPLDGPDVKLVEVNSDGTYAPYPNERFAAGPNSEIKGAIAIRTDDNGIAWVLDMPTHKFIAIDTKTDKIVQRITIPETVLAPTSFLQDFALDQKRGRAIIADMTQGDLKSAPTPAFIVVDLKTGAAQRIAENHPTMMPDEVGGFALNPITIDPAYEYIYFGALDGRKVYRVPAQAFDGDGSEVADSISVYGPKTHSDGISVDGSGNVYITDVENSGFGITTPDGYQQIAKLPEGQSWPDGFSFSPDGYVYSTVNQLNRSAALSGSEQGTGTYKLVRFKPLAPGHTGR